MVCGKEIVFKYIEVFGFVLKDNDLLVFMFWDNEVINLKIVFFLDKLMMFMIIVLIGFSVGFYGIVMVISIRKDLFVYYVCLFVEIVKYVEDGVMIMISNGWLEEFLFFEDCDKLVNI